MEQKRKSSPKVLLVTVIGCVLIALILIFGTLWTGHKAKKDTEQAVSSVSLFYLDELAGRREQVVASALLRNIQNLKTALELMTEEDFSDEEHLRAYQARMKKLYTLEKFAFVDTEGLIYTSLGTQYNISEYNIDYKNITEPEISLKDSEGKDKKVIIAAPAEKHDLGGSTLSVCFM